MKNWNMATVSGALIRWRKRMARQNQLLGWWRVMKIERRVIGWRGVITMLRSVLPWNRVSRAEGLRRYRTGCRRCPIFNQATRACRKRDFGCGCYAPYLVRGRVKGCWARENYDKERLIAAFGRWIGW